MIKRRPNFSPLERLHIFRRISSIEADGLASIPISCNDSAVLGLG